MLDKEFFKIEHNNVPPGQGKILLSEPFLLDSYFRKTVVLLVKHDDIDGSVGFILNRPVKVSVNEVLAALPNSEDKVSLGGPVETDSIHYIHTLGEAIPNSMHVAGNVYWGGDFDQLQLLMQTGIAKESQVRFFVGYSGWEPGQLEKELDENSWVISDVSGEMIFETEPEVEMWDSILESMGEKYRLWTTYPEDPNLN